MYHISIADPNVIPVPGDHTKGRQEEEFSNHGTTLLAIPLHLKSLPWAKDRLTVATLTW